MGIGTIGNSGGFETQVRALATGKLDGVATLVPLSTGEYETVAASATDQAIGATGAAGDFLSHILVIPATTSPGKVSIKDGGGAEIILFAGGASSVGSLVPFTIDLGMASTAGAWSVTTGANVSAIAIGNFS